MVVRNPSFTTSVHSSMPELNMGQTVMNLKPPLYFRNNNRESAFIPTQIENNSAFGELMLSS
jgi:hypothetical protein